MTNLNDNSLQDNPEHFLIKLWKMAKAGQTDQLSEEEKQLAQIMIEHEDEYGDEFETYANRDKSNDASASEQNPFVHMTIHATVENQIRDKDPIEAYQFFNSMRAKKIDRHESIHLVGCILAHFMYDVMVEHKPFDHEGYKLMLKRYKGKKPASIYASLETGFDRSH